MDVILTGVIRSGTTLACHLLNRLPAVVALHEPMNLGPLARLSDPSAVLDEIAAFLAAQRTSLLETGTAVSKARDGVVPDNPFPSERSAHGLREATDRRERVRFAKPLPEGFTLVVKHPNAFTALLPHLSSRWRCFALVRDPLALLLSWNSTRAAWTDGHVPMAEAFDPGLRARLAAEPDRIGRQLVILTWYFEQYRRWLPRERILRYEELIAGGGRALAGIAPAAASLDEPLENRNANPAYDRSLVRPLGDRLLATDGAMWDFYPRDRIVDRLAGE